jgi:hypothetical protein
MKAEGTVGAPTCYLMYYIIVDLTQSLARRSQRMERKQLRHW